jgi:hypothetical protein
MAMRRHFRGWLIEGNGRRTAGVTGILPVKLCPKTSGKPVCGQHNSNMSLPRRLLRVKPIERSQASLNYTVQRRQARPFGSQGHGTSQSSPRAV